MPTVNPAILTWARETAGLSMDEAAAKLHLGKSGQQRLADLEASSLPLSRPLLLRMAKAYRRPLLTFYLASPPARGDRGEDFRSLPARQSLSEPLVDALVRDIRARQAIVRSAIEDQEEHQALPFINSKVIADGEGAVLASIRQTLGIDLEALRAQGSAEAAFSFLRTKVESVGIFVLLIGNLGSHHSTLDVAAFRGFALADSLAPFIVINDQDAKTAWSFTLLHELAHLWIGATGVSGAFADSRVERFCNDVASTFLLPSHEVNAMAHLLDGDLDSISGQLSEFAEDRLLSRSLVAYRLFRINAISEDTWRQLTVRYRNEWQQAKDASRRREQAREGGPDYYVVRRHKLGSALLRFAARSVSSGILSPTKAGKVLGVKPRSVESLLSGITPSVRQAV